MCKSWAQVVCSKRTSSGLDVHSHTPALWIAGGATHLSPTTSPCNPTLCTQIVHKHKDKNTTVSRHFSAISTGPITTTTTYINI